MPIRCPSAFSTPNNNGKRILPAFMPAEMHDPVDPQKLTHMSDALRELAQADAPLAEIVDLRFFCGFTFAEIAAIKEYFGNDPTEPE